MFRSLRPHAVVAAYLAARQRHRSDALYPPRPLRAVEYLSRRVAFARSQRSVVTLISASARDSWAQRSRSDDSLGAAASAMGLFPFTAAAHTRLPSAAGPLMPDLNEEPAFAVHVTSAGEYVRSFGLRIDSVRDQQRSSVADDWARFLQIARQDPAVGEVRAVFFKRGPRDGKAAQ